MLATAVAAARRSLSLKGIAAGALTDIALSVALLFVLSVVFAVAPEIRALAPEKQTAAVLEVMRNSSAFQTSATILGSLASVIGGWLAAAIAKRSEKSETLNGALSGVAGVAPAIYLLSTDTTTMSPALLAGYLVLTPALGFAGGALRRARHRATAARAAGIDTPAALDGFQRMLLVFDLVMIGVGLLGVLASLVSLALAGSLPTADEQAAVLGLAGYMAVVTLLCVAAARALRRRNPHHWRYRIGAGLFVGFGAAFVAWAISLM